MKFQKPRSSSFDTSQHALGVIFAQIIGDACVCMVREKKFHFYHVFVDLRNFVENWNYRILYCIWRHNCCFLSLSNPKRSFLGRQNRNKNLKKRGGGCEIRIGFLKFCTPPLYETYVRRCKDTASDWTWPPVSIFTFRAATLGWPKVWPRGVPWRAISMILVSGM